MHSSGINGEGELRGQPANSGSHGKWLLKWSMCVELFAVSKLHINDSMLLPMDPGVC